jgi:hypothetical protein
VNNKELIEFVFYHEKEIKQAVFEKREDGCLPKTGGGGSGHCRVSDPTAQNAIRKALEVPAVIIEYGAKTCGRRNSITLRHPEKWLKVIQYTRDYFNGTASGALFKMRYSECLTREEIICKIKIRKSQYHAMIANVMRFAEGAATGLGLIVVGR